MPQKCWLGAAVTKTRTGLGLDWDWTGAGLENYDVFKLGSRLCSVMPWYHALVSIPTCIG